VRPSQSMLAMPAIPAAYLVLVLMHSVYARRTKKGPHDGG
jgi:hypothetical protein